LGAHRNNIGREQLQQFCGALSGQGASKGIFFITSSFTKQAMEFVSKISAKIILIDGTDLANLMIQYDVGVRLVRSIQVKRLDLDYFEGEDS